MYWRDEGFLLSKSNFNENSILIEVFTFYHGKYTGIVYGGTSRKQKSNFQTGNKILLNWKSKNENKTGYFNVELLKPIAPLFFEDKKKTVCILSATSILKILLPERETNKNIYNSFENMLNGLNFDNWITLYINWELSLIKELGFENVVKNNKNENIKKALSYNRNLLMENFIIPNRMKFPLFRNILENYFK
tara:strand:- start:535 stop:1110 length:576 start_codon:yes stop_codon:yes gene_type:complete